MPASNRPLSLQVLIRSPALQVLLLPRDVGALSASDDEVVSSLLSPVVSPGLVGEALW